MRVRYLSGEDMAKKRNWIVPLVVAAIIGCLPLLGTSVKQLNLSEMVQIADRVFYGKCISAESKLDPDIGITVREYRFSVLENLKGVSEEEEVLVRQVLMMGSHGPSIPGLPSYYKGQGLLLFLHGDSRLGLTSPVGMSQGTFRPQRLDNGEVGFVNPQKNRNLTHAMEPGSPAAQALSSNEMSMLDSERPVPLRMFREMVRKIDEVHERDGGVVR